MTRPTIRHLERHAAVGQNPSQPRASPFQRLQSPLVVGVKGAIEPVIEKHVLEHKGKSYDSVGVRMVDLQKAKDGVRELMQCVQRTKSTGNTADAKKIIGDLGSRLDPEHMRIPRAAKQAVVGEMEHQADIRPTLRPVYQTVGVDPSRPVSKRNPAAAVRVADVEAVWPKSVAEQALETDVLAPRGV